MRKSQGVKPAATGNLRFVSKGESDCHSGESRNPEVMRDWMPVFAGMTDKA